jgi:hypothetical protein
MTASLLSLLLLSQVQSPSAHLLPSCAESSPEWATASALEKRAILNRCNGTGPPAALAPTKELVLRPLGFWDDFWVPGGVLAGAFLGGTLGFAASGAGNNPSGATLGVNLVGTMVGGLAGYACGRAAQHRLFSARFGIVASLIVATIAWGVIGAIQVVNAWTRPWAAWGPLS